METFRFFCRMRKRVAEMWQDNYYFPMKNDNENEIDFLNQSESEFLDFKQTFHSNNADLIHDILCMANSSHEGNRYLVFGISDNKEIIGIDEQEVILSHNLYDLFKNINLNRIPKIELRSTLINDKTIFFIEIHDLPNKPYFLLKDYHFQGRQVRAGVIYTRTGNTNTSISSTALDHEIEKMYLERLGLNKSPMERFERYLANTHEWVCRDPDRPTKDRIKELVFHYKPFPEFTIHMDYFGKISPFEWELEFEGELSQYLLRLKFHTTELERFSVLRDDWANYQTVVPEMIFLDREGTDFRSYYFVKDSVEFFLNKIIQEVYVYRMHRPMEGVFSVHESRDEARRAFIRDYAKGIKKYVYYFFHPDERRTFRADSNGRHAMRNESNRNKT